MTKSAGHAQRRDLVHAQSPVAAATCSTGVPAFSRLPTTFRRSS